MNPIAVLRRAARMDPAEVRFRTSTELRNAASRVRHAIARPAWQRGDLFSVLDVQSVAGLAGAARTRDIAAAERVLAAHFASRVSCWPVKASGRANLRSAVLELFPHAAREDAARADRILDGRYDLLGYRSVPAGAVPDWHADHVHGRRAPSGFWATIPYLDPSCGDHKVTWELNRHQHWAVLGRAYWLTGDERYRTTCLAQLRSWVRTNPPLHGINWASMLELAFRAISWTYAVEFFAAGDEGDPWLVDLLVALDRQLEHVECNLSRYFSPNTHLTGEALALYVVSRAFPELRASGRRAAVGRNILLAEAARQLRPDGGHAELSTHYHRYSTDFYLLAAMVARAARDPDAARFESAARVQCEYLRTIANDRGEIPLIGDDDGGQLFAFGGSMPANAAPTLWAAADVLDDASLTVGGSLPENAVWILGRRPRLSVRLVRPGQWPSRSLPDSGYFVSRANGGHLVFDAGPHGFLNGGHAHADALQVTLAVGGQPVLVDPGTGTYTMDLDVRNRFRSPRMHNTAVVDGREHAVPNGPFHWESSADARFTATHIGTGFDFVQGTHDAHAPLRHVRTVAVLERFGWLIVDQLLGTGHHELETWWHVHPTFDVRSSHNRRRVSLLSEVGVAARLTWSAGEMTVLHDHPLAVFAPEYGRVEPAPVVRACRRAKTPFAVATFISGAATDAVDVAVEELALRDSPPSGFDGRAFGISIGATRLTVLTAAPLNGQAQPWLPGGCWGTADVQTSGRFAAIAADDAAASVVAVVGGTVTLASVSSMASAVHGGTSDLEPRTSEIS